MMSKAGMAVAAAAGVGVTLFAMYCYHFDKKRRSAPDFKARLLAKRKKQKNPSTEIEFPDVKDPEAMQNFFFTELKLGEDLLNQGQIEEGVAHLGIAIMLTGQASQLLAMMQTTLPADTYKRLIAELPKSRDRVREAFLKQHGTSTARVASDGHFHGNVGSVLEELE